MHDVPPATNVELRALELSIKRLQLIAIILSLLVIASVFVALVITAILVTRQPDARDGAPKELIEIDHTHVAQDHADKRSLYVNLARVTGTPEEVVVEFGVNTKLGQEVMQSDPPFTQTVAMNFYTAKRFSAALQITIDRHEQAFGEVETDITKRLK